MVSQTSMPISSTKFFGDPKAQNVQKSIPAGSTLVGRNIHHSRSYLRLLKFNDVHFTPGQ